jgi:hypothetical protein
MHADYLGLFAKVGDDTKVIKFIDEISPIFKRLANADIDGIEQRFIIENSKYALTIENLETIFGASDNNDEKSDFYTKNYDTILALGKTDVVEYIKSNIDTYAKAVLLNEKITCADEPQERIAELLKNEDIEIETRKAIIKKNNVKFPNIEEFDIQLFAELFNNNAVELTWFNILLSFEKNDFECVKAYLRRATEINGDFDDLSGIKKETPPALISESLKVFTATEVERVFATLPATVSLTIITIAEICDDNLAAFIAIGKIQYNDGDLLTVHTKPKSLCEYLKKYKKDVIENFDAFFIEALPKATTRQVYKNGYYVNQTTYLPKANAQAIIVAVISCKGIDISIKKTLIERCFEIIEIVGYERAYADYIINERQAAPTKILWQFTDNASISESDKKAMLSQCIDNIDPTTELSQYKAYFKTLGADWNKLYELAQKLSIESSPENEALLQKLKVKNLLKYRKSKMKLLNQFVVEATI